MDNKAMQQALKAYIKEQLFKDEAARLHMQTSRDFDELEALDIHLSVLREDIQDNFFDPYLEEVKLVARKYKLTLDPDKVEFRLFCREFLKAKARLFDIAIRRIRGEYEGEILGEWWPKHASELDKIGPRQSSPIAPPRDPGRPEEDWNALLSQLRTMENDGDLDQTKSRIHACSILAHWYSNEHGRQIEPNTIRDKDVIKQELHRLFPPKS